MRRFVSELNGLLLAGYPDFSSCIVLFTDAGQCYPYAGTVRVQDGGGTLTRIEIAVIGKLLENK